MSQKPLLEEDYWMRDFFMKKENSLLARIPDVYLNDTFNLIGLNKKIKDLEACYNAILDFNKSTDFSEESALYYLIHQRYIYTMSGLEDILDKVLNKEFGSCIRVNCATPLIPIGLNNEPRVSTTKMYCYNCVCIYLPKGPIKALDGCAWGKYFPHFLLLTYPYKFKKRKIQEYVPKIYGFRIYEGESSLEDDEY
ncbi:casein kinase ii subunit beta [Vairimorpha apis BRL 01]|uniref:Casein kinase II subunit beta n=1 Tax=Vairimorpha apis BRL 01 TaxID=1037528 RepID=T0MGT4_9MICR|nr:casein kinase ii subunit beta [Vairimorpha apis BRL 01]